MAQIIHNISTPNDGLGDELRTGFDNQNSMNTELYNNKVDKVIGKDLSDNNLTDELVEKINAINDNAEQNIQSDWLQDDNTQSDYIKNKPTDFLNAVGYFDYNDATTQTTPITVTGGAGDILLTNDTLGVDTNTSQAPYGVSSLWDADNNTFDFSELSIGDTVDIRLDLSLTTTTVNTQVSVDLHLGDATPFTTAFITPSNYKSAVTDSPVIRYNSIYIGSDDVRLGGGQFYIKADSTCTVKVNGWFCRVIRKGINIVDIGSEGLEDLDIRVTALETGDSKLIKPTANWVSGFTFDCTAPYTPIDNIYYVANPTTLTLSGSDATLDRIDLICVKKPTAPATLATIEAIEGTLATTELVVPPDYDPSIYYVIKQVIVRALATIPTDSNGTTVSTETVYANGTGEPTEWTFVPIGSSVVNSGGVINGTNTSYGAAYKLVNDIDVENLDSDKKWSLSFKITLKASLGRSYIYIRLLNSSGQNMISSLLLNNGDYGLNANSLVEQSITIDGGDFNFIAFGNIRGLQIFPYKSFAGYYLDDIKFNIGSANNVISYVGIEEAPIDNKLYGRKNKTWSEVVSIATIGVNELKPALKTRITNATVTGTYNLDHSSANDWKLTLTGITTIDESNLPTGTDTIEFTLKVTGDFGLTVPIYWTLVGDTYDGTIWNFFAVQIHKGDATQEATCFISNF